MADLKIKGLPPGATIEPIKGLPEGATVEPIDGQTPTNQNQATTPVRPGMLSRAWNAVTGPTLDTISGLPGMTARALTTYATGDPMLYDTLKTPSAGPSVKDSQHPLLYGIKEGIRGAAGDTADTVAGFTSPVSVATAGLGAVSKGAGAVSKLAQIGTKAAGTGFALKGAADVADATTNPDISGPEAWQKGLSGGAMLTGGVAGTKSAPAYGELYKQFENHAKANINSFAVPGTPSQLLMRATKPTVGLPEFETSLDNAVPALYDKSIATGKPIKSVADVASTADAVKGDQWQKYSDLLSQFRKPQGAGPYNPALVDARPAADAQMNSIPATNLFEEPNQQSVIQRGGRQMKVGDPGIVEKTKAVADLYRTDMPVEQADSIVRDSNAKLRETWNKIGGKRTSALSNPETARLFSMDNALRGELYKTVEKGTGVNPAKGMQLYGDATDIGDTAGKRDTVFSRQQPFPLAQQISTADSLASGKPIQAGLALAFKKMNDSNWLAKEAMRRYGRSQQPKTSGAMNYGALSAAVAARWR
jgi:hypothetical protein